MIKTVPELLHNLLCMVSCRYRVAHCRRVDELPQRMSKRLREECISDIDPTPYKSATEMWAAMEREWELIRYPHLKRGRESGI